MKKSTERRVKLIVISLAALTTALLITACPAGPEDDNMTVFSNARVINSFSDLPNPNDDNAGYLYYVIEDEEFYYSNGTEYVKIDLTGEQGPQGADGSPGEDGISILWQGAFDSHPSDPSLNWAYYNTTDRTSYIYDGTAWQILYQDVNVYAIGDKGPGGGRIFFDDADDGVDDVPGVRYLEAAPASTEWNDIEWGSWETDIGGDDSSSAPELTAIGTGYENTAAIVTALAGLGETGKAAQLCEKLVVGDYDDWFLPSKDELDLMYENLHQQGLGGFAVDYYWSSSEDSDYNAWDQIFTNGNQYVNYKDDTYRVRAVRAF
jgi:hypothetical protein